jgi:4-diphosphocytidyl-2-C-methyl-D-erythritol kinase
VICVPNVKINLGLNVLRKRQDGYHDIETLFVPYNDIHDTLEVIKADDYSRISARLFAVYGDSVTQAVSPDGKIMITIAIPGDSPDWDPMDDLCVKAYRLLDADYDLPSVKIFLEKTAPVGAGLGGGSSDAATVLKILDSLFSLGLSEEKLAVYAAKAGSDCPFFIYNRPMLGRGRGEILTPFELNGIFNGYEMRVIVPEGISVSTSQAYKNIVPRIPEHSVPEVLAKPVEQWKEFLFNDFEPAVFADHPELSAIKKSLYDSGAVYASMSGSGSALFALYKK